MYKIAISVGTLLCLLSVSTQVFSQNAKCPSSKRFTLASISTGVLNLNDGAYKLFLGSAAPSQGAKTGANQLFATAYRNGVCLGSFFMVVEDGKRGAAGMKENTNLCLGDKNDHIQVLTKTTVLQCGRTQQTLFPFIYNGYKLSIYGGGGNDLIKGGSGQDKIHGGNGIDWISTNTGDYDKAFGEANADLIVGSTGNSTVTNGGRGNDIIRDKKGIRDHLIGGSGDDDITSGCSNAKIFCNTGSYENDIARSKSRPNGFAYCKNWVKTKCN